jgi:hypothetical protein
VFLDPGSILFKEQPDFVLYQEIIQISGKKTLQNIVIVDPQWIPDFVIFNAF